jgi:hypothetical protein
MTSKAAQLSIHIRENYPANSKSIGKRAPFFGVGINDSDYISKPLTDGVRLYDPAYYAWANILTRCFDVKYHKKRPTYSSATISNEWLSFMAFRGWWLENHVDGWHLDKDLLVRGNKAYMSHLG